MLMIDSAILVCNVNICKNIEKFDDSERGLLSQNILAQLRNLVEYIAEKIYANGKDIDPNDYKIKTQAIEYIKTRGQYRFLNKFHDLLQITASHYTLDEGKSERLMLKYYEYLLKIKVFLKSEYRIDVFENINDFPLDTDSKLMEYYEKIAVKINQVKLNANIVDYNERYYIQKIKPFFVNNHIYYEITFSSANDKVSRFEHAIAFTELEFPCNYAVRLSIKNDSINILGKTMPIQIIDSWEISIRPCELNNFARLFGSNQKINSTFTEYRELMRFLTETKLSFIDLIESSDDYFQFVKSQITQTAKTD